MSHPTWTGDRGGDVRLAGGLVADGSGERVREADVLLDGDVIAAVEPPGVIAPDGYDRRDLDRKSVV